jgi:hypothetical protein
MELAQRFDRPFPTDVAVAQSPFVRHTVRSIIFEVEHDIAPKEALPACATVPPGSNHVPM